LIPRELSNKNLVYQNFLREFPVTPELKEVEEPLERENVGMFVNGVEVVSNRSGDEIYYGNLVNVDVENGGSGYDVVNPPNINISDSVGSAATAYAVVENGSFESIEVTYGGYDLRTVPSITITGGEMKRLSMLIWTLILQTTKSDSLQVIFSTTENLLYMKKPLDMRRLVD
jgi:hypothetical protein